MVRRQLIALALILVITTSGSAAEPYSRYVLVPFAQAVDELLYAESLKGEAVRPKDASRRGAKLWMTQDGKGVEVPELMFGMFFCGCYYDGEGSYYMPEGLYAKVKDKLIQKRQGRLESFATPAAKQKMKEGRGVINLDSLADYETYVWDTEGEVYRYVHTLRKVPEDAKLQTGELLYKTKPMPGLKTASLEDLVAQHLAREKKAEKRGGGK
jgi:hypothetical protein